MMLYHWAGICDSSRMNLVRSVTSSSIFYFSLTSTAFHAA
jgi:hypothetical protein